MASWFYSYTPINYQPSPPLHWRDEEANEEGAENLSQLSRGSRGEEPPFLNYGRFRIPFLKMAWRCWWRLLWEKQRTQNTKSKNLLVASLDCLILSSPLGDIDPFASKIASVALLFYAHNFTSYSFATMIFARFAVALALCASTSAFM